MMEDRLVLACTASALSDAFIAATALERHEATGHGKPKAFQE
jgi:hypothetical protein